MDLFNTDWSIQPSDWRTDLNDAIKLILDFNENKNEYVNENENVNKNDNVNDKTIIS